MGRGDTVDGVVVLTLLELTVTESLPPLSEEHALDGTKPRGDEGAVRWCLLKEGLELLLREVASLGDFVRDRVDINIGLDHKHVVDLMLTPRSAVHVGNVVNTGEVVELLNGHLFRLNAELVLKLADGSALHTHGVLKLHLTLNPERVTAAGVGPESREGNLVIRALLKQELTLRVEEEHTEGAVQETLVDVLREVGLELGARAHCLVIGVDHDHTLFHESDLGLVKFL